MFTSPLPPPSFLPSFHLSIHSSIQLFIEHLLCSSLELHSEKTKGCSLGMERLKQLKETIRFKEGQTHSEGYTSPLSPPSPSSLFPYCALCSQSLALTQSFPQRAELKSTICGWWMLPSVLQACPAGFHRCLRDRQNKFQWGLLGSLSRAGRLSLETWAQKSDKMLPGGDSSCCSAPLQRVIQVFKKEVF